VRPPYSVRFDPSRLPGREAPLLEPIVAVVALPKPEVEPTTVVDRVFPSGDRLPENQLKLYVHFSAPMSHVDGLRGLLGLWFLQTPFQFVQPGHQPFFRIAGESIIDNFDRGPNGDEGKENDRECSRTDEGDGS